MPLSLVRILASGGFTHTLTTLKRRAANFWGRQIFWGGKFLRARFGERVVEMVGICNIFNE